MDDEDTPPPNLSPLRDQFPCPLGQPGVRLIETRLLTERSSTTRIRDARGAAIILRELIGDADREHFVALYLGGHHDVTHAQIISCGAANSAPVHPREVFKGAILANAVAIIVAHNHPSGDVRPSPEDEAVKRRLEEAGQLIGIEVLDSLIVGPEARFYTARTNQVVTLPRRARSPDQGQWAQRAELLEKICKGLMADIDEVLERQGEAWWDETVTSGTHYRNRAEELLDLPSYDEPMQDRATPEPP
jgi:DNA repair protein RadC